MTMILGADGQPIWVDVDRMCVICQCTDARACPGGCSWSISSTAEASVCTACEQLAADLGGFALGVLELFAADPLPHGLPLELGRQLLTFLTSHEIGPYAVIDRWQRIEKWRKLGAAPVGVLDATPEPKC